jgi:hypothetical protein
MTVTRLVLCGKGNIWTINSKSIVSAGQVQTGSLACAAVIAFLHYRYLVKGKQEVDANKVICVYLHLLYAFSVTKKHTVQSAATKWET